METKSKKKKETPLNDIFVVVLLLGVLGGVGQIIKGFISIGANPIESIFSILLTAVALYGIYLILCLKKMGYWFLILPKVIDVVVALIFLSDYDITNAVVMDLGSIAIISLLMLLRKNGKNAYQLLWNGYNPEEE